MRIQIAARLRPYSHLPGICCLIPGSTLRVQVFPSLLRIHKLDSPFPQLMQEIPLAVSGPVKGFTVQQDLERDLVRVWGETKNGFLRYQLSAKNNTPFLAGEKLPEGLSLPAPSPLAVQAGSGERLNLGIDKAQDWPMVLRRNNPEEILPFWFALGHKTECPDYSPRTGTAAWLAECAAALAANSPENILQPFMNLFATGFEGILSPRLADEDHQGFALPSIKGNEELSPLILLKEGAKLIRSLFIRVEQNCIHLLPALPVEFHCGRFINLCIPGVGRLDMEWSNKELRRCVLRADNTTSIQFIVPHRLKRFRLRAGYKDRGFVLLNPTSIEIHKGQEFFLDNFQK